MKKAPPPAWGMGPIALMVSVASLYGDAVVVQAEIAVSPAGEYGG